MLGWGGRFSDKCVRPGTSGEGCFGRSESSSDEGAAGMGGEGEERWYIETMKEEREEGCRGKRGGKTKEAKRTEIVLHQPLTARSSLSTLPSGGGGGADEPAEQHGFCDWKAGL